MNGNEKRNRESSATCKLWNVPEKLYRFCKVLKCSVFKKVSHKTEDKRHIRWFLDRLLVNNNPTVPKSYSLFQVKRLP